MAWGNKLTKEELTELGLNPDDLKSVKDKIAELDAIKTSITEVKTSLDGLQGIRDSLAALEGRLPKPKESGQGGEGGSGNGGGTGESGGQKEEEPDFLLDPAGATAKVVAKAVDPLRQATLSMYGEMSYNNFKSTNPRGFAKFEKEIKEMWDKQPIPSRANPELIQNIYKIVLADHIDEIAKEPTTFFVETGNGGKLPDTTTTSKKPEDQLSKVELEQASKWGLSAQEYLDEKLKGAPVGA